MGQCWTRDKRGWSSMKGRVFPCILGTQTPCISEHRLLILKQGPGVYPVYTLYTPVWKYFLHCILGSQTPGRAEHRPSIWEANIRSVFPLVTQSMDMITVKSGPGMGDIVRLCVQCCYGGQQTFCQEDILSGPP